MGAQVDRDSILQIARSPDNLGAAGMLSSKKRDDCEPTTSIIESLSMHYGGDAIPAHCLRKFTLKPWRFNGKDATPIAPQWNTGVY